MFRERLSDHLVPCLSQFAAASGNDAHWKPLNFQVLLKTRHSSALVKRNILLLIPNEVYFSGCELSRTRCDTVQCVISSKCYWTPLDHHAVRLYCCFAEEPKPQRRAFQASNEKLHFANCQRMAHSYLFANLNCFILFPTVELHEM